MSATEREFIFDAVVGFLTSPLWNTPVRSFIEQNSVVFDPDGENPEEYNEIHKSYKTMVEGLLTSFLKDVGISEQQFMDACKEGRDSSRFSGMNRDVFEQMWATEDYEVFKRFMTQKNIELQLQALQIIQQIHNVQMPMPMPMPMPVPTPVAAPPGGAPIPVVPPTPDADEEALLQEVLRRSKEEYESQQKDTKGKTKHEVEKTLAESKEESERQSLPLESVVTEESTRLKEIAKREQEELEKALQISLEAHKQAEKLPDEVEQPTVKPAAKPSLVESKQSAKTSPVESKQAAKTSPVESKQAAKTSPVESKQAAKTSPVESKRAPKPSPVKTKSPTQDTKPSEKPQNTGLPPLSGKPKKVANTPSDAAAGWIQSAKEDIASSPAKPKKTQEITPDELKRRAEYLKQQRDKLLALKKQEREKSLTKYTEQQPKARPTSSRAARRVTAGEQVDSSPSKSGEDDAKKLAMRRALADCLKREVIDKE